MYDTHRRLQSEWWALLPRPLRPRRSALLAELHPDKMPVNRRYVNPATCFFAKLLRFGVVMLLSLFQLHIVELPPTATFGASLCAFRLGICSSAPDTRFVLCKQKLQSSTAEFVLPEHALLSELLQMTRCSTG